MPAPTRAILIVRSMCCGVVFRVGLARCVLLGSGRGNVILAMMSGRTEQEQEQEQEHEQARARLRCLTDEGPGFVVRTGCFLAEGFRPEPVAMAVVGLPV